MRFNRIELRYVDRVGIIGTGGYVRNLTGHDFVRRGDYRISIFIAHDIPVSIQFIACAAAHGNSSVRRGPHSRIFLPGRSTIARSAFRRIRDSILAESYTAFFCSRCPITDSNGTGIRCCGAADSGGVFAPGLSIGTDSDRIIRGV